MALTHEKAFSASRIPPKPAPSCSNETSATRVVVPQPAARQPGQDVDKTVSLGIAGNESIDDANRDMDLLARQSFEDL